MATVVKASAKSSSESSAVKSNLKQINLSIHLIRGDDDDEGEFATQFEADLAMMDSEDMDVDTVHGDGPETQKTSIKWARPDLPQINPKKDAVVFQQLDVDHYTGLPMGGMPGAQVSAGHFEIEYFKS